MAERNEQVLERVRQQLNRQSDLGSRQLFEMAQEMDPSMAEMSLPQFHARYVLPIKREQAAQRKGEEAPRQPRKAGRTSRRAEAAGQEEPTSREEPTKQRRRARQAAEPARAEAPVPQAAPAAEAQPAQQANRDQIRSVFLEFALEFSQAESKTEIVKVLSKLDRYIDRIAQ
jgi:hypothetical protein